MNKRPMTIIVILSLITTAVLSLTGCTAGETASAASMMGDHEGQMSVNADDHHDETDDHHDEMDDHHDDMDDHHEEMGDHHHGASNESSSSHPALTDAREIIIVGDEFSFEPAEITLHKGEKVNITLVNEGQLPHELSIEEFGFHIHAPAGETVTGGLTVGEDGTYEIGCYIAGHFEAGMFGELTVTD